MLSRQLCHWTGTWRRQWRGCRQCRRGWGSPRGRPPSPPRHRHTAGHSPPSQSWEGVEGTKLNREVANLLKVLLEHIPYGLIARSHAPLHPHAPGMAQAHPLEGVAQSARMQTEGVTSVNGKVLTSIRARSTLWTCETKQSYHVGAKYTLDHLLGKTQCFFLNPQVFLSAYWGRCWDSVWLMWSKLSPSNVYYPIFFC